MLVAAHAALGSPTRSDDRISHTEGSIRIAAQEAHITTRPIQSVSTTPIASDRGPTSTIPIGISTNDPSVS